MDKRVYADTDLGRLGASLDPIWGNVRVWHVDDSGPVGVVKIDELQGGKLTAGTLRKFFSDDEQEPRRLPSFGKSCVRACCAN